MPLPVLMVVASEDDGGMARVAASLAKGLPAFDIAVRVVVHRDAPLTEWLRQAGIERDVVPELIETPTRRRPDGRKGLSAALANLRGLPAAAAKIASLADRHACEVIYSHNTWGHYVAAAAARSLRSRRRNRPVASVWHVHNDHSHWVTRIADRWAIRAAGVAAIAAVSRSIGQPFDHLAAPLTVVTNGIDMQACDAALGSPMLRACLRLPGDAIVAVYAGRLVAHKGIHVLLDAARLAVPAVPNLHVVVLGGNPRHEARDVIAELRAQVESWGMAGRIHLPGHVEEVERYIADADLAAVPSTCADGFPLAAIEPLCLGVPVIASALGGLPEIVENGVNGVLVPAGDAPALAGAIVSLAREPARRRQMARAARDGRDRFDARRMTRQVAEVLRRAAASAASPM